MTAAPTPRVDPGADPAPDPGHADTPEADAQAGGRHAQADPKPTPKPKPKPEAAQGSQGQAAVSARRPPPPGHNKGNGSGDRPCPAARARAASHDSGVIFVLPLLAATAVVAPVPSGCAGASAGAKLASRPVAPDHSGRFSWHPRIPGRRSSSSMNRGSRAAWYNIAADLPVPPLPPLHPGTGQPIGPDDLAPLFPMALIGQEVSAEREIEIPEPVRDAYRLYRPSPLYRAHRLERALDTPAHIYYKYEGVSPAGSHKPNTAIPQAFYNKQEGVKRLATETGAGQWGSALAFAGRPVRARGQGLHGPRQLRPEAVPPDPHGDVRGGGRGRARR